MHFTLQTQLALHIGTGASWALAYILIIRRGFVDRTCGMPMVALCANISWEFLFSFVFVFRPPYNYIYTLWFLLDTVIVYQFLRYARPALAGRGGLAKYPRIAFGVTLPIACFGILTFIEVFRDQHGVYSGFTQNLVMSVLFVTSLLRNKSIAGQSLPIAWLKMAGAVLPAILFYNYYPSAVFLVFLYLSTFAFDLAYVIVLYVKIRQAGLNPWTRF